MDGPSEFRRAAIGMNPPACAESSNHRTVRPQAGGVPAQVRLPDFIIAGAMKCATTSLHHVLNEHPDVFIPPGELRFFAVDDFDQLPHLYIRGADRWSWRDFDADWDELFPWYASFFDGCGDVGCVGEDSPAYMSSERAPSRIARVLPNVRLIFMLRDPVDRAYSHYWHNVRTGYAYFDFDETLRLAAGSILERGKYREQLLRYGEHFPREQMKIVLFEKFAADPLGQAREVLEFLGLDSGRLPAGARTHSNKGRYRRFHRLGLWRNYLMREYYLRRYRDWIPGMPEPEAIPRWKHWLKSMLDRVNRLSRQHPPPMPPATREFLRRYYRRENRGLDEIVGIDLRNHWPNF